MCADATGGILGFCWLQAFIANPHVGALQIGPRLPESLHWLAFALAGFTLAAIVINAVLMVTALYTWFERRLIGRFTSRLGPNRWGPFGLFQPFADVMKLITKEDIIPDAADRPVFTLAPLVLVVPGFMVFAVIPFGADSFLGRLNIGVLFIIGVTGINTLGVFMAGWASKSKFGLLGAMRGVAMLISYEVPMALSVVGVVLLAGSLGLKDIAESQPVLHLLVQPLGFLVFMIAASAEMSRAPFDMIEAESELVAGYHTEYSGAKWAIFQQAEFTAPLVTATVGTVLFLGGTSGPAVLPGPAWFLLKAFVLVFFFVWARVTWPRMRVNQIMEFAWKALFPLALLNMFVVAAEMQLLQGADGGLDVSDLWIMAAVNWALALIAIFGIANLLGQSKLRLPVPVPSPLANMGVEAD